MPYKDTASQNAWRRNHPEVSRRWRRKHRQQHLRVQLENSARRRFGMSRDEQKTLHNKVCDICGKRPKKMCVDHKIPKTHRGVLCQQCNTRLGWFEKLKKEILKYVKRGPCACRIKKSGDSHAYRRTPPGAIESRK